MIRQRITDDDDDVTFIQHFEISTVLIQNVFDPPSCMTNLFPYLDLQIVAIKEEKVPSIMLG